VHPARAPTPVASPIKPASLRHLRRGGERDGVVDSRADIMMVIPTR
jgi:hypothetical protein